jgi:hypothetical protein
MPIRSRKQLQLDQAEILAEYRREVSDASDEVGQMPVSGGPSSSSGGWGRVSEVVTSDANYGPHLVVQPQAFSGLPRAASDASVPAVRCYPAPNRVVGDYAVDEHVKIISARGALIADKSA